LVVVAALILDFAMTSAAAFQRVETGFLDRTLLIEGELRRYQIYVPAEYDSATRWPAVLHLHWNGVQGTDGLLQTTRGLAESIRQRRREFPGLAIFPQARPNGSWTQPQEQAVAIAALDRAIAEFAIDPARVAIAGYSMGAIGAYRIVARSPERFSAILAIAGRVEAIQKFEALDRASHPFVNAADPFAALAERIKGTPVRLYHGDQDASVAVDQSRRLSAALRKVGADVQYIEYPGTDHVGAAEKAFAEPSLFEWLLSRRRGSG
jgi:predicted peptidase